MADASGNSSLGISSEHASAAACSALRYDISKNVGILAVIMAIRKLCQVQRQVALADLMERTHHPTLQQAPEAVQVRRMDLPAHILTFHVIDRLVRKLMLQTGITGVFIRGHERDVLAHGFPHELTQGMAIRLLDHLT